MKAENFEELHIWQKAREVVNLVYEMTRKERFSKDWGLVDQIRRSAVSVMSNIAEGFERGGNAEFIQFLYIAKGSCGEMRSQVYIAYDQKYISEQELNKSVPQAKQISGMIANFISYLKKSNFKGPKFTK